MKRCALAFAFALFATASYGDSYPSQSIRMIVPYAAGGGTDLTARMVGEGMTKILGRQVVIENKAGGNTILGTQQVAEAKPDGYTLLVQTISFAVNPALYKDLPYDSRTAFKPVALVALNPLVLAVNPSIKAKTVSEFIQYLKDHPGTPYGSSGNGGAMHLAAEVFQDQAGVKALHVPYRGENPVVIDLMGGKVMFGFTSIAATASQFRAGTLRPLAILEAKRSPNWPDVPTAMESGLPNYTAYTWTAILAPAGTPDDIVQKLNAAIDQSIVDMLKSDEVRQKLDQLGFVLVPDSTPASTSKFIADEMTKWKAVVDRVGITVE